MYLITNVNSKNDYYFNFVGDMVILTMYTSTIFVIASQIAAFLKQLPESFWITDMPISIQIVQICEAINMNRAEGDLEGEMMLYFKLLDLIRSPEMIKMITTEWEGYIHDFRADWMKSSIWNAKRMIMEKENKRKEADLKELEEKKKRLKYLK